MGSYADQSLVAAVPGEVDRSHAPGTRVAETLVDVQARDGREATPEPLAGDDEVEVQVHEQPEEAPVGRLVDLGERSSSRISLGAWGALAATDVKCAAAVANRTR
jgi:hypothetical protein